MAASRSRIAVTGATGGIGGRVARRLAAVGRAQRLIVRDPARAPTLDGAEVVSAAYGDAGALRLALESIDTLFLVSAAEAADRVAQHIAAVDAASDAGVRHLVYLSFLNAAPMATFTFARDHWATEQHIRARGLSFTFLRDSMYADFLPLLAGGDGVIRGPAGDGAISAVVRDDVADVAAAVLLGDGHEGCTYDVTGPRALTLHEVAAELSRAAGRPLIYREETLLAAFASRSHLGAPRWEVEGWVSSYAAIGAGEMATVSDTVRDVAGHEPTSLEDFLRYHPESVAHLRPG